ncbi:MAG: flagellar hook-length control protein FliK [Paenibacillaceae bacterium]|jgi:flagellar hook-length control protein FliK|nr:flagellar hook-length control protein FliK [Paenibacillaceae bacterium]
MQTTNALVMTMQPGTATAAAVPSTGGAVSADASFGKLLVQVLGGTSADQNISASLPDLAQLMAGLVAGLSVEEAAQQLETADPAAWSLLLEQLSEQPELLDKLIGEDEVQSWLVQASLLLQAIGQMPVQTVEQPAAVEGEQQQAESVQLNAKQAQEVLQAFARTLREQPDNVFTAQLREKLEVILASNPQLAAAVSENTTKSGTDGKNVSREEQSHAAASDSAGKRSNVETQAVQAAGKNFKVLETRDGQATVQVTSSSAFVSRLEMLAAKSMPVNRPELLAGVEKTAPEQTEIASTGSDDAGLPVVSGQDSSRFTPVKGTAPAENMVRSHALAEDISKFMIGKMRIQTGNGLTEARLTLTPESLGQVDVKISMQNGQLVAHFAAQTAMGKDALEAQMAQLRTTLQNQGIQVERIEVTQSPTLQSGMFQDQRGQQHSQQSGGRNESKSGGDGSEEYAASASAILNRIDEQGQDGFDVTA